MIMKALILGGTGAIGKYLVKDLVNKGYDVYVTSRSQRNSKNSNVKYIQGNAKDQNFLLNVLNENKFSLVVDLMIYSTNEFGLIIGNILDKVEHYIFVSTYRVFSDVGTEKINEDTPYLLDVIKDSNYLSTDEYALSKARQEKILKSSKYFNWTIVRPSITYSTYRHQLTVFESDVLLFRSKFGLPIPTCEQVTGKYTTMTWAGDVSRMISTLANNTECFREHYNVVSAESNTWEYVSDIYKLNLDLDTKFVKESDYLYAVDNIWQYKFDRSLNRACDNSKIVKFSGIEQSSFTKLSEGLSRELNWFKGNSAIPETNARLNGRIDYSLKANNCSLYLSLSQKLKYSIGRNPILDSFAKQLKK